MDEIGALLSSGPEKIRKIMCFNFDLASYLHPSRRGLFFPELPFAIWNIRRASQYISNEISRKIGASSIFVDPNYKFWDIALLSGGEIEVLARYSGAVLMVGNIRSSLSRDSVLFWKNTVGKDAYEFAINSASLLPKINIREDFIRDRSPTEIGYLIFASAIKQMPDPVAVRCNLKLPELDIDLQVEPFKAMRFISTILEVSRKEWNL